MQRKPDAQIIDRMERLAHRFFAIVRVPLVLLIVESNGEGVIVEAWTDNKVLRITRPFTVNRESIDDWGRFAYQLRDAYLKAKAFEVPDWAQ